MVLCQYLLYSIVTLSHTHTHTHTHTKNQQEEFPCSVARGLGIWHCHCSILGRCWSMGSIPGQELPHATGLGEKKPKQQELRNYRALGSSHLGSAETNLTSIHEDAGSITGLALWVKDPALP